MSCDINMSMPDIHSCSKLSAENALLRKKLRQVKRAKDEVEDELNEILESQKVKHLLKTYCNTRDSGTQTDIQSWSSRGHTHLPTTRPQTLATETDLEKKTRIINMHAQLLRRYEKEVKQNMTHTETISELTIKIAALEKQLLEEKNKINLLEKQMLSMKGTKRGKEKYLRGKEAVDADAILMEVAKERDKLHKENRRLRQELKGLDKGFFDEVEDLKYTLQQSKKLNKEYEQMLKRLCQQYGIPYHHPKHVLEDR